jgi:hypothetical protein
VSGVDLVTFLRARLDEIQEDVSDSRSLIPGELHWSMPDWLDRNYLFADVAAKRRIVDEYERAKAFARPRDSDSMVRWAEIEFATKALTAPFAAHPDFDPAWAVEA